MFIYALLISACAAALYEKIEAASKETAIICATVSLLSALAAIIVAPWQFHLLIFLGIIFFRFNPVNREPLVGKLFLWRFPSKLGSYARAKQN